MQKINLDDCDVVIIQKQTSLERYTGRVLKIDFLDYLSQDKVSQEQLYEAHAAHVESRELLISHLQKLKLSFAILNLDELKENRLNFFNEENHKSGLNPKKNVVISLGGDGTLLHASHHVGGSVKLLGINSCPNNSVGHLCSVVPSAIEESLVNILVEKNERVVSVRRLRLKIDDKNHIPLALNDILITHLHPAATSRYQLSLLNDKNETLHAEKQLSSGLWISTAAGSTAAIASYGFPPEPLSSNCMLGAVREPYAVQGQENKLNKFILNGDKESLSVFSRMRQGIVCLDGPDFSLQFGFGETLQVTSPKSASLQLIQ